MKKLYVLGAFFILSACFVGPKAYLGAHSYGISATTINDECIKQALQDVPNIESFARAESDKRSGTDVLDSFYYDYRLKGYDYPFRFDIQVAASSSSILHSQEETAFADDMTDVKNIRNTKRNLMIPVEKEIVKSCRLPNNFFQESCVGERSCTLKNKLAE